MEDVRRLDSLTGLRAVAALVVFLSHARWLVPNLEIASVEGHELNVRMLVQQGNVGVSFFFLLSGFVLAWAHRSGGPARAFYGRRFARIYPNQLVTWCAWLVLVSAGVLFSAPPTLGPALANLLLVQAWVPIETWYFGMNPPSWSLSNEVFFYAVFPALVVVIRRLPDRRLLPVAGTLTGLAIAIPALLFAVDGRLGGELAYYFSYVFPPTRLIEFALGVVLGVAVSRGRWSGIGLWWPTALAVAAYVVAGRTPRILLGVAVTIVPFVFLVLAAAGADLAGRRSPWRHPAVTHLGRVSFAFYLVQYAVIDVLRRANPSGASTLAGGLALVVLAFVITLAIAEALHALVERPAERLLRSRLGGSGRRLSDTTSAAVPSGG